MEMLKEEKKRENSEQNLEFENNICCMCNGFYGASFMDPTCEMCHAFLYSTVTIKEDYLTILSDEEDDSDSGNDEPLDNGYRSLAPEEPFIAPVDAVVVNDENLQDYMPETVVISNHKYVNIEHLPPEVLIHTFGFLDDISMWSIGQVNTRLREIMNMFTSPDYWRKFMLNRWPLFKTYDVVHDWYELYTSLVQSSSCLKCLRQMAARKKPIGIANSWREHRLKSELRGMKSDPPDGIQAIPLDSVYGHWQATIKGPVGSPYEGGIFFLYIQIPYTYPMTPPIVRFLTKIFHPNISRHGDIGIDSIHNNWSLALTISKVLISIQSLLTDPVCDVCMEPTIGNLYLKNKSAFEEEARTWTWNYAMHQLLPH